MTRCLVRAFLGFGLSYQWMSSFHCSFFPNPSLGIISFELSGSEIVEIYNLQGILMKTELVENGDQLDLSNFAKGIYFVKNKNGEIGQKLIIE